MNKLQTSSTLKVAIDGEVYDVDFFEYHADVDTNTMSSIGGTHATSIDTAKYYIELGLYTPVTFDSQSTVLFYHSDEDVFRTFSMFSDYSIEQDTQGRFRIEATALEQTVR